ncbi:MAG: hypothetical protein KBF37_04970 [Saprospiraceae bacterium]|jgi:hypothetical protein|nr:hypothetical protein [Saprospiraceae bacterium]MBP9209660.1 hypothetical protein [Saprospiraceae bacterium]
MTKRDPILRSMLIYAGAFIMLSLTHCTPSEKSSPSQLAELKDLVLYEVAPWQYVDSGGIKGLQRDLKRLSGLFVNSLVLQPVQLRDQANNPFNPASPFAISDYAVIDPNLGSAEELISFIHSAHSLGIKVFYQWHFSETGPHHRLREEHPDFYFSSDKLKENRYNPDFVTLNISDKRVASKQSESFGKFVNSYNFDGYVVFGIDSSNEDFVSQIREICGPNRLLINGESVKVKGLSHSIDRSLFEFFKGVYNNTPDSLFLYSLIGDMAPQGRINAFVDYHTNFYKGTDYMSFPNAYRYFAAFAHFIPGTPWMLGGQEYALVSPVNAFRDHPVYRKYYFNGDLYRSLNLQRRRNPALWNDGKCALPVIIAGNFPVVGLERSRDTFYCTGIFNFSPSQQTFVMTKDYLHAYDLFNKVPVSFPAGKTLNIGPYQAFLFSNVL